MSKNIISAISYDLCHFFFNLHLRFDFYMKMYLYINLIFICQFNNLSILAIYTLTNNKYLLSFFRSFIIKKLLDYLTDIIRSILTVIMVHNNYDLLLISDKEAVEKRLYVLQQQGYIYATEPT